MDIGFFFGAGAEIGFNLPSGGKYTKETMLTRRAKLYDALNEFYRERCSAEYAKKYEKQFLFRKDSITFRKMVYDATGRLYADKITGNELSNSEKSLLEKYYSGNDETSENLFAKAVSEAYDKIITDPGFDDSNDSAEFSRLINYFTYYGVVEKDFSTIINPNDAGLIKFWRLINYFWSAYFSILLPLIRNSEYSEELKKNGYKYVLNNLKVLTEYIYSDDFCNQCLSHSYYDIFKNEFSVYCALTTNYTPFVRKLQICNDNDDRYAFLAGELSLFEVPNELQIVDIRNYELSKSDFIFPFLFTQAPIKPIIEPRSIREYAKALTLLNEIDCLIIVGYSLGSSDNHINALLRDFVMKPSKTIVFCDYSIDNDFNKKEIEARIKHSLRIHDEIIGNIIILKNDGDAYKLSKEIKKALDIKQ